MLDLLVFLLILSLSLNVVAVLRYRDAEKQIRILKSLIPNDKKADFDILKHMNADTGQVTHCVITVFNRRALPVVSDLTGIPLNRLADAFDEDEKKGEPFILETKEFKA